MAEISEPFRVSPSRLGLAFAFLLAVMLFARVGFGHISITLVIAAGIGAYMAMDIGANDVAINVCRLDHHRPGLCRHGHRHLFRHPRRDAGLNAP